jgi:hypothetical protein
MKKRIKIFTFLVLFQICCFTTFSQIRTLCYKGVISYIQDFKNVLGGSIVIGDTVTGKIKYDMSITDSSPIVEVGDYYNYSTPSGITVNVASQTFKTDSSNVNFLVEAVDNKDSLDNLNFVSYYNTFPAAYHSVNFFTHIHWQLDDTNQSALSSTVIPTFVNLSSWQQGFGLTIDGINMFADTAIIIRSVVTLVDTCEFTTPINTISKNETFLIYPNPASETLIIETNFQETLIISDITSKLILTETILCPKTQVDISALKNGSYFLKVGSIVKKLIVNHN